MQRPLRIGIVGLGTGAMACHSVTGDRWRFYEIDPAVVAIARNPAYFTYLERCARDAAVIVGDARLTLAREAEGSFDFLLIDAFSSDAIPVHLITIEALRLYARLLTPRGILALHVSNQNLDLPPVVESNLGAIPELKGVYLEGETGGGAVRSQAILIARSGAALASALPRKNARMLGAPKVRAWSDDYANVFAAIVRRYRARLSEALKGAGNGGPGGR